MPEDRKPEAPKPEAPKAEEKKPEPKEEAKGLTEAQIRRIVRTELAGWQHDAAHSTTESRMAAQRARDEEAGVAAEEPITPTGI